MLPMDKDTARDMHCDQERNCMHKNLNKRFLHSEEQPDGCARVSHLLCISANDLCTRVAVEYWSVINCRKLQTLMASFSFSAMSDFLANRFESSADKIFIVADVFACLHFFFLILGFLMLFASCNPFGLFMSCGLFKAFQSLQFGILMPIGS